MSMENMEVTKLKMQIMRELVELFRRPETDEISPASLLAVLPAEAIMKPKAGAKGFDANMVGYKGIYILKAAIERLGPGGWVEVPIYGSIFDATLANGKEGIGVNVELVVYFPGLHRGVFAAGTGDGQDLGDAQKSACTTARKRAMMEIGIGWDGYTEHTGREDPLDAGMQGPGPQITGAPPLPGRAKEEKKYTPPAAPAKPAQAAAKAQTAAPEPPRTFADAANAAAGPDYEQAFGDVFELLASDGVISRSEKGQKWFRDRAAEWGFFGSAADGAAKVQLKERAEAIHLEKLGQLHAAYKEIFGADEDARRNWLEKMVGKRSTADCTLNERTYALEKLADLRREKSGF